MDAAQLPAPQLGRILIAAGLLTEEQLAQALEEQSRTGSRLGEIIVQRGFISGPALANALAEQHGGVLKTEYGFATGLGGEAVKRAASEGSEGPLDSQLRTDRPASIPQLRTAQPQGPPAPPEPPAPEEPVAPEQPVQPAEWQQSAPPPPEPEQSEPEAPPPLRTAEPPTENSEVEVAAASPPPLAEPPLEMPPLLAQAQAQVESEPVPSLEPEPTPFAAAEEPVLEPVELHVPLGELVQESLPPLELPPPPEPEPAPLAEAAEPVPEPVELRPLVAEPTQVVPSVPEPVAVEPVQEISPLPELPLLPDPQPAPAAEAVQPVQEAAPEPEPMPEPVSNDDDRDALIESLHARLEAREQEVAKLRAELDEERSRAVQVHVWPEDQPESAPPPAQKEQYLLCVPTPAGYVLLDRVGPLPSVGQSVAVPEEEGSFTVTKVVRLPRNGRPCAYLQRA